MKPSFVQIAIVILIIVIIFGAPKLPQLARSLGQSMKIFKSEVKDLRDEEDPKNTTAPGELKNSSAEESTPAADNASTSETAARKKQDPQSHDK